MIIKQEDFVRMYMEVYNQGGTMADLTKKVGGARQSVYQRVVRLQAKGVHLPNMNRGFGHVSDADTLNKIVEEMS